MALPSGGALTAAEQEIGAGRSGNHRQTLRIDDWSHAQPHGGGEKTGGSAPMEGPPYRVSDMEQRWRETERTTGI